MAAYTIVEVQEVMDPDGFAEYREKVGPILAQYGAKMIARGNQIDPLDGDWESAVLIIFEFESQERIRAWRDSEAYREIIPLRDRSARLRILSVPGA